MTTPVISRTAKGGAVRRHTRCRPWPGGWGVVMLFLLNLATGLAAAPELENPNKVKAAFLRNFAHYVTWPTDVFAATNSPWNIGILGDDPFGDVLERTFRGRTEQERPFHVFRADTLKQLPPCQIVFVAYKDDAKRHAALQELQGRSVLTVGDAPEFLQEGGIIRFQINEHVEMSINLDQARAASLTIPTKMLEVSREVLENGTIRKLR